MTFSLEMKRPAAKLWMLCISIHTLAVFSVSADVTDGRFVAWNESATVLTVEATGNQEILLKPDAVNATPGWALNHVGKKFSTGTTYSYPDNTVTNTPVRLYLIDTAVANPATFVTANPNLTFEGPILVRGSNDPEVSTPRAHGTQMLSLIAGVDTGVAPGTPIHVVNYDIYPNVNTTASLVSAAIIQAIQHHQSSTDGMRSVICIATSSIDPYESFIIDDSIDVALAKGITVILSAGNIGQDAADFTPPSNGTKNGVICVGASDSSDVKLTESNFGVPVDILAPGLDVRTRSESATSAYVTMTGTSPATALVTGAVLAKLSASPTHTPAGIESALKAAAEVTESGPCILRTVVAPDSTHIPPDISPDGPITSLPSPSPLTWDSGGTALKSLPPGGGSGNPTAPSPTDTDSDGIPDIVEIFHGMPDENPQGPVINLTANQEIQFKFPISSDLFDGGDPFILRNGYTWRIRCSSTMSDWTVPDGYLSKSTDAQGRAWIIATFPANEPSCFARIEIIDPAAE